MAPSPGEGIAIIAMLDLREREKLFGEKSFSGISGRSGASRQNFHKSWPWVRLMLLYDQ
jgi:hypothetical protein